MNRVRSFRKNRTSIATYLPSDLRPRPAGGSPNAQFLKSVRLRKTSPCVSRDRGSQQPLRTPLQQDDHTFDLRPTLGDCAAPTPRQMPSGYRELDAPM